MVDVGALIKRPRSEMLRIRIGLRRIRKILPLRAINDRPYGIHGTLYDKLQFIICNFELCISQILPFRRT